MRRRSDHISVTYAFGENPKSRTFTLALEKSGDKWVLKYDLLGQPLKHSLQHELLPQLLLMCMSHGKSPFSWKHPSVLTSEGHAQIVRITEVKPQLRRSRKSLYNNVGTLAFDSKFLQRFFNVIGYRVHRSMTLDDVMQNHTLSIFPQFVPNTTFFTLGTARPPEQAYCFRCRCTFDYKENVTQCPHCAQSNVTQRHVCYYHNENENEHELFKFGGTMHFRGLKEVQAAPHTASEHEFWQKALASAINIGSEVVTSEVPEGIPRRTIETSQLPEKEFIATLDTLFAKEDDSLSHDLELVQIAHGIVAAAASWPPWVIVNDMYLFQRRDQVWNMYGHLIPLSEVAKEPRDKLDKILKQLYRGM